MDLFQLLGGILNKKQEQIQRPQGRALAQPARKVMTTRNPQAEAYEQAFDRGDYNSPDIIGVDPAQFGYPEDNTFRQSGRQTPNAGPINGSLNPMWQQQKGFTPYNPGEGLRTNFNRFR